MENGIEQERRKKINYGGCGCMDHGSWIGAFRILHLAFLVVVYCSLFCSFAFLPRAAGSSSKLVYGSTCSTALDPGDFALYLVDVPLSFQLFLIARCFSLTST